MKYRGKRIDNGELIYGSLLVVTKDHNRIVDSHFVMFDIEKESVSIFFGKKDKNGTEIYTNDKVRYRKKEYEVRYFEEYGAFGLWDEEKQRPLGRHGSSTKYEPYFMIDHHVRQMEVVSNDN